MKTVNGPGVKIEKLTGEISRRSVSDMDAKPQGVFRTILFATDFSPPSMRALPFAAALSERHKAKFFVAHVLPEMPRVLARPSDADRIIKEERDYAEFELKQIVDSLQREGRNCEPLLGKGNPGEVITNLAESRNVDLIVVCPNSRGTLGKLFVGSVAEEIIREAVCPVLTIGPHVITEASVRIKQIVCAVDFSPASIRAAEIAVEIAEEYQARLTLKHIIEKFKSDSPAPDLLLQRLSVRIPGRSALKRRHEVVIDNGDVAERILCLSTGLPPDLIAMGAKGAGAFAQTVSRFGSIVHKVVFFAMCPVLTVGPRLARE